MKKETKYIAQVSKGKKKRWFPIMTYHKLSEARDYIRGGVDNLKTRIIKQTTVTKIERKVVK